MTTGLGVIRQLLDAFHREDIRYCHWKSNNRLLDSMNGLTDLDLLIDRRDAHRAERLFAECGFKRFAASPARKYPAIEDFIALDQNSVRLVHCHVHYRLMVGEKLLKEYRLPWEEIVLRTRQWRSEFGIYVIDPHLEMILLITRASLKISLTQVVWSFLNRRGEAHQTSEEFEWLREQVDERKCCEQCADLLGSQAAVILAEVLRAGITGELLLRFRRHCRATLKPFRTYGSLEASVLGVTRRIIWTASVISRHYLRRRGFSRRTIPMGGIIVAVVGADGSGKSTITQATADMFGRKFDVLHVYFGSGDGQASLLRRPLKLMLRMAKKIASSYQSGGKSSAEKGKQRSRTDWMRLFPVELGRTLWALVLALEKRSKLQRARRASNRGVLVVSDRYPQAQIMGLNDGPLLYRWRDHRNTVLRGLARWEALPYEAAEAAPPDVVVRLHITVETALQRKPEMSSDDVKRRIAAVASLRYSQRTRVVEIDANRPLEEVQREVMTVIWESL